MERSITVSILLLAFAHTLTGAPTQTATSRTPCRDRHRQVRSEIAEYSKIVSEPDYIPECDGSGRFWMPSQCSSQDLGFCFCVVPETGEIKESTVSHFHSRESIECVTTAPSNETRLCQQRRNEYLEFRSRHGDIVGNILYYYPDCNEDGSFKGLQRDSVSFFCVDTELGTKIPGSEEISRSRLLAEFVCQAYSEQWKNYLDWLKRARNVSEDHEDHEEVNATSCKPGFEFVECGCASVCQPGNNMEEMEVSCDTCAPVCTCPQGYYELNGSCISGEECLEAEDQPEQHRVLDIYGAIWREYNADHPHSVIEDYRKGTNLNENGETSEYSPFRGTQQPPIVEEEEEEVIEQPEGEETTTLYPIEEIYPEEEEEEEEEEWDEGNAMTTMTNEVEDVIYNGETEEDPSETPLTSTTTMDDYYTMEEESDFDDGSEELQSTPESNLIFQILQGVVMQQKMTDRLRQVVNGMSSTLANVQEQIQSVLGDEADLTTITDDVNTTTKVATKPTTESVERMEAEFEDISSPLKKSGAPATS